MPSNETNGIHIGNSHILPHFTQEATNMTLLVEVQTKEYEGDIIMVKPSSTMVNSIT